MDTYEKKYKEALEKLQEALAPKKGCEISGLTRACIEEIFPELKESEGEKIKELLKHYLEVRRCQTKDNEEYINCNHFLAWLEKQGNKPQGKSAHEAIKEEKVDNANKVEPKFKVGDWITAPTLPTAQVVNIIDDKYELEYIDGVKKLSGINYVDYIYFHWTIADAKNGDVLASNYNKPFIYNGNHNSIHVGAYCGITTNDKLIIASEECHWTENLNIHPANKDQRDILMNAMNDDGYVFDFDKKELKKMIYLSAKHNSQPIKPTDE